MYVYPNTVATGDPVWGARVLVCGGCTNFTLADLSDMTRDGKTDLFVRETSTGDRYVYPNTATGGNPTWGTRVLVCGGCRDFGVVSLGDVTNDGKTDLVVRRNSVGTMILYPGTAPVGSITWGSPSFL